MKRYTRILFWMLLLSCAGHTLPAANGKEDSLLLVLRSQPDDTAKVITLNELFKATFISSPSLALDYGQRGLQLARRLHYVRGVYRLCNNLGVWHSRRGNYKESLNYYQEAKKSLMVIRDPSMSADCEMNIGSVYYKMGAYDRALDQYALATRLYQAIGDTLRMLDAVNNIGAVYMEEGRYPEALEAQMAALKGREVQGDPVQIAITLCNVGTIYQRQGMTVEAMATFQRALQLSASAEDHFGRVAAMTSIGELLAGSGEYRLADSMLRESRVIASEIGDQFGLANATVSLADLHERQGRLDSAYAAYAQALNVFNYIGRMQGVATALNRIGYLEMKRKHGDAARTALERSLTLSDSLNAKDLSRDNHRLLSKVLADQGDFQNAYRHQERFFLLQDSLYSKEKTKQIAEMQARYESKGKQDQINRLNLQATQDQLRIAESGRKNLILLAILLSTLLLAVIFVLLYAQKQRHNRRMEAKNSQIQQQRDLLEAQNRQIMQINANLEEIVTARTQDLKATHQELDTFLYQSTHALRRPLLRVDGLTQLLETEQDPQSQADLRSKLRRTLGDMDDLLHKLVQVSETSQRIPARQRIDAEELVRGLIPEGAADSFQLEGVAGQQWVGDAYLLQAAIGAVMDNAWRFRDPAKEDVRIQVRAGGDSQSQWVVVEDNGLGIKAEQLPKVTEMFFRGSHQQGGNGLGLYVAAKVMERLQGSLEIDSVSGSGTRVRILWPKLPIEPTP